MLSLENGSLQIQIMDEEKINTDTTYYQYSCKDYTQFGNTIIELEAFEYCYAANFYLCEAIFYLERFGHP